MIRAFRLAVAQLGDPALLGIVVRSLLWTLLLFAGMAVLLGWALAGADPCAIVDDGASCVLGSDGGGIGAVMLVALATWFLFPAVAIGVVCAYADDVVAAVERRHYPAAAAGARPLGFGGAAWLGARSSLRVLLYNLLALPAYVVLLVTGIGTAILFVLVNGAAFGRDLGETAARRHVRGVELRAWLRSSRADRLVLGTIVTALFLVPVLNLFAPVIGAAAATHLFQGKRRS